MPDDTINLSDCWAKTNFVQFEQSIHTGIGSAKALGFGMLCLASH